MTTDRSERHEPLVDGIMRS